MLAKRFGHRLHRLNVRFVRSFAPLPKKLAGPSRGRISPESIEVFSHQVGFDALEVLLE